MNETIYKMAIVSPQRQEISRAMGGTHGILGIEHFHDTLGEIIPQERHYRDRRDYFHEALLQRAVCVLHPSSGVVLTNHTPDKTSILITGSGKKDFGEIIGEKTAGLEEGITGAEKVFGECYALAENRRGPLYVFHTRIVMAQTRSSVSSTLGSSVTWESPKYAMTKVGGMEQSLIQWIALEVQKRRKAVA